MASSFPNQREYRTVHITRRGAANPTASLGSIVSVFASIFRRPTRLPIVMSALVTVALIYAGWNAAGIVNRPKTTEDVAAIADAAIVRVRVKTPGEHDAVGTGFFFTERGDIMTAFHLANQGDKRIKVQFKDGKTIVEKPATIALADEKYDFTVLHVDGVQHHPFLKQGDSGRLVKGQAVVVDGYPFGLPESSVSKGIISAPVQITPEDGMPAVEFDAPANQGNSGGPLLDMRTAEWIGVVNEIYGSFAAVTYSGVSFAAPSNLVQEELKTLGFK